MDTHLLLESSQGDHLSNIKGGSGVGLDPRFVHFYLTLEWPPQPHSRKGCLKLSFLTKPLGLAWIIEAFHQSPNTSLRVVLLYPLSVGLLIGGVMVATLQCLGHYFGSHGAVSPPNQHPLVGWLEIGDKVEHNIFQVQVWWMTFQDG